MSEKKKRNLREEKKLRVCKICKGTPGLIRKYKLNVCWRCFKEMAPKLGFRKFD